MGFRFQKRIRIFRRLTLNLSKSGTSWTVGGKGASINVRGDKVTGNAGIPGTGISYRSVWTTSLLTVMGESLAMAWDRWS